jgi:hypothetical protein
MKAWLQALWLKLPGSHQHYGYEVTTHGYIIECERCGRHVLNVRKIIEDKEAEDDTRG